MTRFSLAHIYNQPIQNMFVEERKELEKVLLPLSVVMWKQQWANSKDTRVFFIFKTVNDGLMDEYKKKIHLR